MIVVYLPPRIPWEETLILLATVAGVCVLDLFLVFLWWAYRYTRYAG